MGGRGDNLKHYALHSTFCVLRLKLGDEEGFAVVFETSTLENVTARRPGYTDDGNIRRLKTDCKHHNKVNNGPVSSPLPPA